MVLSCFSDMADRKRKIANSFQNASHENKFSKVVKSVQIWMMDGVKCEKEHAKFFIAIRGGSRTTATSKMERFVIIVNGR